MSRENQIPGIPSYKLLRPPDGRCRQAAGGENAKRSVTPTLRRLRSTWAPAWKGGERCRACCANLHRIAIDIKIFPSCQAGELVPGWPAGGGTSNPRWRRLSASARWAAAGSRRLVERERERGPGPAEPSTAPATNTDSQQYNPAPTSLTLISLERCCRSTLPSDPWASIWPSTGNGFCGKSGEGGS